MTNKSPTRRIARTSTFPHAFAHPEEFYRERLAPKVRDEVPGKPYGWGIVREEQLGCEVAARLLSAELDISGRRVVRNCVAKALFSTACYGFNGSQPILHIAGIVPSYRNIKLPRLDLDGKVDPVTRQSEVVTTLDRQVDTKYPAILNGLETGNRFTNSRIERNARVLGQSSLELAVIPLVELDLSYSDIDVQDFVAMTANSLKLDVARSVARDGTTPSVRQFIHRGSPALSELISSSNPEVSDLALEVCLDL